MTTLLAPVAGDPDGFGSAPLNRREALRLLALGLAAGVAGCKPAQNIVPLVENPAGLLAGAPLQFATALPLGGFGRGVLATSVDGRPTKVSGNPLHPASLGATDVFAEAEILGLYDPDRSRTLLKAGQISNWDAFLADLRPRMAALRARRGDGLALFTGRVTSPTLLRQIAELQQVLPSMRRCRFEAIADDNARAGSLAAFGRRLDVVPHLDRADVVFCLGADPLGPGPAQIRNADGFRRRRTVRGGSGAMQRIYAVETAASLTGLAADHRLARAPDGVRDVTLALGRRFGAPIASGPAGENGAGDDKFLDALAADLRAAGKTALVLVGEEQPPELHAFGHWLNHRLGAYGTTLDLIEPVDPVDDSHADSIRALAADLSAGRIDTLLVFGNPAFDAPADLDVAALIGRAPFSVHLGAYYDETGNLCRWHIPETHPLEAWSDIRAVDNSAAIVQPLIDPLYASRSAHEMLAALAGADRTRPYDLVRDTWAATLPPSAFEDWWLATVENGLVPGSAAIPVSPPRKPAFPAFSPSAASNGLALVFRADPTIFDGRFANNAWLQECPKPVTHETWGNALRVSPLDAARLGLEADDAVRIEADGGGVLDAPILIDRGQAPGTVSISLGYGRTKTGAIGLGLGANAFLLRRSNALWTRDVRLARIGRADAMPRAQTTLDENNRDLAPEMRLADLAAGKRLREADDRPDTFYASQSYEAPYRGPGEDYAWAMAIDTTLCIGCNACVVACQSENNVPVVGPDEIRAGRTMQWLRIDAYEKPETGRTVFQPIPCMHCEKAPCEPVCPVGASVHDNEGLNVQVYNRCVGTRFCQANCPYKVRRFNFFGYAVGQEYANLGKPPMDAHFNPDVTVRGRGVMEKCTYCVQRIAGARQTAETEHRRIRDGEVITACASACPTRAIRFGDLSAAAGDMRALRGEPQHYALLAELGTKPRTTYLAKVRNPNPDLEGDGA